MERVRSFQPKGDCSRVTRMYRIGRSVLSFSFFTAHLPTNSFVPGYLQQSGPQRHPEEFQALVRNLAFSSGSAVLQDTVSAPT